MAQRIAWQKAEEESGTTHDALLVLEHAPVYTLGRSAKAEDVRFPLEGIDDAAASAARGFDVRTTLVPIDEWGDRWDWPTHATQPNPFTATNSCIGRTAGAR